VCDSITGNWVCLSGARPYSRTANGAGACLPFQGAGSPIRGLSGALTRVPTDDGRCLWIADEVWTDSEVTRNVAFVPDLTAPFGTCPAVPQLFDSPVRSVVAMAGAADPSIVVQIMGAYRIAGGTRVLFRLFRLDQGAVFGVTELGTSIGRWDAGLGQIVVGDPSTLRFAPDLDLGDDSLVLGDYAFAWGCSRTTYLSRECLLGRLDAADTMQLFIGGGQWSAGASASAGVPVFSGGPWISSVSVDTAHGGLIHIFAPEFGSELDAQFGSVPEGPWTAPTSLGPCDLPSGDTSEYCAGPVTHTELADPTRNSEVVVSYGVGTTASPAPLANDTYWTRIAWLKEK